MFVHPVLQGGPTEDILDAAGVDGWIEGPTWASPLNSSQLTALLLLLNAARELRDGRMRDLLQQCTCCCWRLHHSHRRRHCPSISMVPVAVQDSAHAAGMAALVVTLVCRASSSNNPSHVCLTPRKQTAHPSHHAVKEYSWMPICCCIV